MPQDPYINRLLDREIPVSEKSPIHGRLVCILQARADQRGLDLCPFPSRAVLKGEIHELIVTAEETGPGKKADRIAYLGYFEVTEGGVLWVGDQVTINGHVVGTLAGYDLTHFPNHMNIIVRVEEPLKTGLDLGYHPGDEIHFEMVKRI